MPDTSMFANLTFDTFLNSKSQLAKFFNPFTDAHPVSRVRDSRNNKYLMVFIVMFFNNGKVTLFFASPVCLIAFLP